MNPYIQGFITAIVYIACIHFLPKKIAGITRYVVAIAITVAIASFIQLIIDLFQ